MITELSATGSRALVAPELAKVIADRAKARRQGLTWELDDLKRRTAEKEQELAGVDARLLSVFAMAERLRAAGFDPKLAYWTEALSVEVEPKQLTAVYKVVGRLAVEGREVENSRRRIVKVTLRAVHHDFVRVHYRAKLSKDAKCRIVAKKCKGSTYHALVCER